MKKLKVAVLEKNILQLLEDGKKDDLIDLEELVKIDTSYIDRIIEEEKDKVYSIRLEEARKKFKAEKEVELSHLQNQINILQNENKNKLILKEKEVSLTYQTQIKNMEKEFELFKQNSKAEIEKINNSNANRLNEVIHAKENEYKNLEKDYVLLQSKIEENIKNKEIQIKSQFDLKIAEYEKKCEVLNEQKKLEIIKANQEAENRYKELEKKYLSSQHEHEMLLKQKENELKNKHALEIEGLKAKNDAIISDNQLQIELIKKQLELEKNTAVQEMKNQMEIQIKQKEDIINDLQRRKTSMNIKQTGEDLEAWCDEEINQYMQNGLYNCTWEKDNLVLRDDDEVKGSKADFIFKVYADSKHKPDQLLSSICLEMKDETINSTNRKTNADFYKQLDKNRNKKGCKYALLVSNLEMDKPNIAPIFKVSEYENMYVVRPAYMMVFLNMIVSLTTRFANLVLEDYNQKIQIRSQLDLIEIFNDIKKTYLDKPLQKLANEVENIRNSNASILKYSKKIDDSCEDITRNYLNIIQEKLNKFEIKIIKEYKKISV